MPRPVLVVILSIILVGIWVSLGTAKEPYSLSKAYNMDKAAEGWGAPPLGSKPSSVRIAADLLIGRPLGLATTIAATGVFIGARSGYSLINGVFIGTIPFNLPSRSVRTSAWGVKQIGGWTFKRHLGQYDPRFSEEGIFRK